MSEAITHALEPGLTQGLVALGLQASASQTQDLLRYADALLRWNATYNLTAVRSPEEVLTHHLLDCLAVLPKLPEASALSVMDVGAGGGLPGVVWAIMRPNWQITCVDAVAKKMAFVQQSAGLLGLRNLRGQHARLDAKRPSPELRGQAFDLITCRAFSSLADFVALTKFHVKHAESHADLSAPAAPKAPWLALKGKHPDAEIAALDGAAALVAVEDLAVPGLNEARCLVWLQPAPRV